MSTNIVDYIWNIKFPHQISYNLSLNIIFTFIFVQCNNKQLLITLYQHFTKHIIEKMVSFS